MKYLLRKQRRSASRSTPHHSCHRTTTVLTLQERFWRRNASKRKKNLHVGLATFRSAESTDSCLLDQRLGGIHRIASRRWCVGTSPRSWQVLACGGGSRF